MSATFPARAENGTSVSRSARLALACSILGLGAELAFAGTALALGTDSASLASLTGVALALPALGLVGFLLGLTGFQDDRCARVAQLAAWLGAAAVAGPWLVVLASLASWVVTGG